MQMFPVSVHVGLTGSIHTGAVSMSLTLIFSFLMAVPHFYNAFWHLKKAVLFSSVLRG